MKAVSALFCGLLLVSLAGPAHAGSYGDYNGITVIYKDVNDVQNRFGAPTVSGDSIDFDPTFLAECNDCGQVINVNDRLNFTIEAKPNRVIDNIILTEAGDFTLNDFFGLGLAEVTVSAPVFIEIFEVDNVAINQIDVNANLVFTPVVVPDGVYNASSFGNVTGQIWTGFLEIDLNQVLADNGYAGGATLVEITMDNILTAAAVNGGSAMIEKKDTSGLSVTVIPEPSSASLLALGLVGIASIRRRRGSA